MMPRAPAGHTAGFDTASAAVLFLFGHYLARLSLFGHKVHPYTGLRQWLIRCFHPGFPAVGRRENRGGGQTSQKNNLPPIRLFFPQKVNK
jgi:hypothetical protein